LLSELKSKYTTWKELFTRDEYDRFNDYGDFSPIKYYGEKYEYDEYHDKIYFEFDPFIYEQNIECDDDFGSTKTVKYIPNYSYTESGDWDTML
jgi:hypothetical protein